MVNFTSQSIVNLYDDSKLIDNELNRFLYSPFTFIKDC